MWLNDRASHEINNKYIEVLGNDTADPMRGYTLADIYTRETVSIEGQITDGLMDKTERNGSKVIRKYIYPAEAVIERRRERGDPVESRPRQESRFVPQCNDSSYEDENGYWYDPDNAEEQQISELTVSVLTPPIMHRHAGLGARARRNATRANARRALPTTAKPPEQSPT